MKKLLLLLLAFVLCLSVLVGCDDSTGGSTDGSSQNGGSTDGGNTNGGICQGTG